MVEYKETPKKRTFLSPRDFAILAVQAGYAGLLGYAAHQLGMTHQYGELMGSFANAFMYHPDAMVHFVQEAARGHFVPETLKPIAMAAGFMTGAFENIYYYKDVLEKLQGKAVLKGTGDYHYAEDGVRERNVNCGDIRIAPRLQERVRLGSGLTGGAFTADQFLAWGVESINHVAGGTIVGDWLTGYLMGRIFPLMIINTLDTLKTANEVRNESLLQSLGALRELYHHHTGGCGLTAVHNQLKHYLKFGDQDDHINHKRNLQLLDLWNAFDRRLTEAFAMPATNVLAAVVSFGTYTAYPGEVTRVEV